MVPGHPSNGTSWRRGRGSISAASGAFPVACPRAGGGGRVLGASGIKMPCPVRTSFGAPGVGGNRLLHSFHTLQSEEGLEAAMCRRGAAGVKRAGPKMSSCDGVRVSQEFFHHFLLTNFCRELTAMSLVASEDVGLSCGSLRKRSSSGKCARSRLAPRRW